jgi:outer membrane receptor protein involved in Fe transport
MRRHTLRFGGLFRQTERDAFDKGYSIRTRDWTPNDPRWQLPPEQFFDGRFSSNGETLFELGVFNAGGGYRAEDRLVAGYGMAEMALTPRLRLIGGARLERSEVEVAYEDVLGTRGTSAPAYTDMLPAAVLNYDVTDRQKLRFSVSQTLSRPEYREIAPVCYRAGLGEEQRCGNPNLVRTLIRNYDARWEWYPSPTEVLSLGVFAKQFQDPIEPRYQGRSGTNTLGFENAESAVNYGVEVEVMHGLGFLSERLAPLSVFTNATLMNSEVNTGIEGDPRRAMTGQAPYVFNAGLTYASASRSPSATILFNVVGERIINARPSGQSVADMLEQPRPMLDLALRFPVFGTMAGKLDVKNLLDSPYEVRRFRATVEDEPAALSGGAESREALIERFVQALEDTDVAALGSLALSRAEFAYLYYPHTRFTRRPYELSPALVWFQMENYGGKGLNRALSRYGGRPLGFTGHRCADEPELEEHNRIWSGCVLDRVDESGTRETLPLLGPILERDGHYKFVSFANRL